MKRLLKILIPALVLLFGAAGAAWYVLTGQGMDVLAEVEQKVFRSDPGYLELDPFVVPVLQRGQVTHHLTIRMGVELKKENYVKAAKALRPKLMDAVVRELQGLYSMRIVLEQGFDMPLVEERLLSASERVLGRENVTGLQFTIAERRLPPND